MSWVEEGKYEVASYDDARSCSNNCKDTSCKHTGTLAFYCPQHPWIDASAGQSLHDGRMLET